MTSQSETNWAGNLTYSAARLHRPKTTTHLQDIIRHSRKVRALGSRHSFNTIADTPHDLISLEHFDKIGTVDTERSQVTIGGGVRYGQLCRQIDHAGFALPNLASLPHISVAGACATATHGSGDGNGNLATAVVGLEMISADGDLITLTKEQDGDQFLGAVVGLGGLGIITKLTLQLVPAFNMRQDVYEYLPLEQLENHLDVITGSGYSVSLFTAWRKGLIEQVWVKRRVDIPFVGRDFFGATSAEIDLHPIRELSPIHCTAQMGVPGAWYDRLSHFRLEFTPSSGEELQSEYFIPRHNALAAFRAMYEMGDQIAPLLQISEIRTIAADNLWMSPCYQQDCVAIHFTWHKDWAGVRQLLPLIEARLIPLAARPHWGKLFTVSAKQLQPLYPKLPAFRHLLEQYDPQGKFRNPFLEQTIFAGS